MAKRQQYYLRDFFRKKQEKQMKQHSKRNEKHRTSARSEQIRQNFQATVQMLDVVSAEIEQKFHNRVCNLKMRKHIW